MHFYSEAPITSFFPLITSSKKRKTHTELTSSGSASKKRQKDHTSTSRQGTNSKAKDDGQERHNILDNGTIPSLQDLSTPKRTKSRWQQTSERHIPLLASLNTKNVSSQTPMSNALPPRNKHKTSPQTPPLPNATAESQRSMELTTLSPLVSRKSLDLHIEKLFLPTPSTVGWSASHHNGHSDNDRYRVVQGHLSHQDSSSSTHSDTSLETTVLVSIPSSQSQLMANTYFEDEHHLTLGGESTSHAIQMFISSSQSQFLSPLDDYDSPQRLQPRSTASNPELDIIPSSQSQETDLGILSDPEECCRSIRSRKPLLQCTPSDELFPVPILETGWSDGSLDPEKPIQGNADIPCVTNNADDSATESETEPETEEKDSYYRDHPFIPMESQPSFSQLSVADPTSLDEDSLHKDLRNSQPSSQDLLLVDQTSSFASLPSVVKEFQSMFGSDDESYPPDFPMSLR